MNLNGGFIIIIGFFVSWLATSTDEDIPRKLPESSTADRRDYPMLLTEFRKGKRGREQAGEYDAAGEDSQSLISLLKNGSLCFLTAD
jgi:hypothetical protein